MGSCGGSGFAAFGCWMGNIAAILFFFTYLPQIILNYRRKSTQGFSPFYIAIRLVGLSFQLVNGLISGSSIAIVLAGFLMLVEMALLIFQFAYYNHKNSFYYIFLLVLPACLVSPIFPSTIPYTNYVNPACQIGCWIPFISACLKAGTTHGVSLLGQHINFAAGILGMMMCSMACACSSADWLFYVISLIQACSIFAVAMSFDEYRIIDLQTNSLMSDVVRLENIDGE